MEGEEEVSSVTELSGLTAHPGSRSGKLKYPGVTGRTPAGRRTNKPALSLSLSLRTESRHPLRPAAATPRSEGRQCQVETTGMIKTGKNCWGGIDCCFVEERWRGTPGGAKVCWFLTRLRTHSLLFPDYSCHCVLDTNRIINYLQPSSDSVAPSHDDGSVTTDSRRPLIM